MTDKKSVPVNKRLLAGAGGLLLAAGIVSGIVGVQQAQSASNDDAFAPVATVANGGLEVSTDSLAVLFNGEMIGDEQNLLLSPGDKVTFIQNVQVRLLGDTLKAKLNTDHLLDGLNIPESDRQYVDVSTTVESYGRVVTDDLKFSTKPRPGFVTVNPGVKRQTAVITINLTFKPETPKRVLTDVRLLEFNASTVQLDQVQ